jgi:hypothetical protein
MDCARRVVVGLLSELNSDAPRVGSNSMTFARLCNHFEQRDLAKDNTWRSYSTKTTIGVYPKLRVVPHWGKYDYPRSRQSKSNLGFAVCPWRKAVVQRSETSCPFCLIMPVDMSFLTATRFAWSGRARNAEPLRACSLPSKSGPQRKPLHTRTKPWFSLPHAPGCGKVSRLAMGRYSPWLVL